MDTQLNRSTTALRTALGLMATLAGIDKFFNLLADWPSYIAPVAQQLLPVTPDTFMWLVGVVEIAVGLTVLAIRPSIGAFIASAWLVLVAANLVLGGDFDIAVRDLVLAVAAYTLGVLEQARATTAAAAHAPRRGLVTA